MRLFLEDYSAVFDVLENYYKDFINFSLQLHESTGAHAIVCPYPQLGYFFLGDIFELRLPAFLKHTFSNTSTNHNIVAVSFSPFSPRLRAPGLQKKILKLRASSFEKKFIDDR